MDEGEEGTPEGCRRASAESADARSSLSAARVAESDAAWWEDVEALRHEDEAWWDAQRAQWAAETTPADRQRLAALLGGHGAMCLQGEAAPSADRAPRALTDNERAALEHLDGQGLPRLRSARDRWACSALSGSGLMRVRGDALVWHPDAWWEVVSRVPGTNAAALRGRGHGAQSGLACLAALPAAAQRWLGCTALQVPIVLRARSEARWGALASSAAPDAVAALGACTRALAWGWLQERGGQDAEVWSLLLDHPLSGDPDVPHWRETCPMRLCCADDRLATRWLQSIDALIDVDVQAYAALVSDLAADRGHAAAVALLEPRLLEMARAQARATPLPVPAFIELLAGLGGAPDPEEGLEATLIRAWGERTAPPDWQALLRAARLEGVVTWAEERASEARWWSFDAPGEGVLVQWWSVVVLLAEGWSGERGERWQGWAEAYGAEPLPWWSEERPDLADALEAHPSVVEGELGRSEETESLSSYAHGLHDAVPEAYGDSYAPGDPFRAQREGHVPPRGQP